MAEPREYDREYRKPLPGSLQLRIGHSSQKGTITRFVVQLEYWLDGAWRQVVRYDHDPDAPDEMAHDVRTEGLHVDVYRDGVKERTRRISGPLPANVAFNSAEEHLHEHLQDIVERYERWHGIRSQ